jgi:hypothetical protein
MDHRAELTPDRLEVQISTASTETRAAAGTPRAATAASPRRSPPTALRAVAHVGDAMSPATIQTGMSASRATPSARPAVSTFVSVSSGRSACRRGPWSSVVVLPSVVIEER